MKKIVQIISMLSDTFLQSYYIQSTTNKTKKIGYYMDLRSLACTSVLSKYFLSYVTTILTSNVIICLPVIDRSGIGRVTG